LAANLPSDSALDDHLLSGLDQAGIPRGLAGSALPFHYGRLNELEAILDQNPGEIAGVIMEPVRSHLPEPNFLKGVRAAAKKAGAVLIFDEITAAFRMNSGGAHLCLGVDPDIAIFAKAMSNGYAMAAVIGRREVMEAAQSTFISSTYWTERIGPSAALVTIRKHRSCGVAEHLNHLGTQVQEGWKRIASELDLDLKVDGIPPLSHFSLGGEHQAIMQTLFTKQMLDRGFLATKAFYATFAHTDEDIAKYLASAREVFAEIRSELEEGTLADHLNSPVAHSGFARLA
jgi:glutamate-1-semialdehyde 2,1-aminomutase